MIHRTGKRANHKNRKYSITMQANDTEEEADERDSSEQVCYKQA